jgi:hypothetical protein
MPLLSKTGRIGSIVGVLLLSAAAAPAVYGQSLSLSEANAVCMAGGASPWVRNANPKTCAEMVALRYQRETNQSKIAIGMSREELLQLLGKPDNSGAAWMDSPETTCIWTYNAIREPGQADRHRNLEVTLSLKRRVVSIQFRELMFEDTKAFGAEVK